MTYTNSSMVVYKKLSPNHSGQRTHSIDRITPHCVVGQCTAEGLEEWFEKQSTQASSNYGIDCDGRVLCMWKRRTVLGVLPAMPMTRGRSRSNVLPIPRNRMLSGMWCIRH